jgi:hypothetical protein
MLECPARFAGLRVSRFDAVGGIGKGGRLKSSLRGFAKGLLWQVERKPDHERVFVGGLTKRRNQQRRERVRCMPTNLLKDDKIVAHIAR